MKKTLIYLILTFIIVVTQTHYGWCNTTKSFKASKIHFFKKQQANTEKVEGKDNPLALHDDALAFYNTNDINDALNILNKIPDETKSELDYLMLANIMQDKGDRDKALEYLEKSLTKNKKFYKAYYNLGNIYQSENDYDKAIEYYKKANWYNRDLAYSYYNIGVCYTQKENYKTAKSYFNRAILRKNTEPDFYYNLAFTYKKLGNTKNAQKALDAYNKLIAK